MLLSLTAGTMAALHTRELMLEANAVAAQAG
jgi:hypothetical protein